MVEIHAYHGWGFNGSFWDDLSSEIPKEILFKAADRGYFGGEFEPEFSEVSTTKIVFAHSFGLHWCPQEKLKNTDVLIIFNGFGDFLPSDFFERRKELKILKRMHDQFKKAPESILNAFLENCFHPQRTDLSTPKWMNRSLLARDLIALRKTKFIIEKLDIKTISLTGSEDQIVSIKRTEELVKQIGAIESGIIDGSGHALPIVNSSDCWSYLIEVVPIFAEYANKNGLSKSIAESFGRSAQNYHQKANIQRKVAEGLVASLMPWKDILPPGPILEVGCGTGFLTGMMINEFPDREFIITDASEEMVDFAKKQLGETQTRRFQTLNVDEINETEPKFSCIVSNFAAQWFSDPAIGLEKLGQFLLPGGLLLVAFPGNHSFSEWYQRCLELGLPFTANSLPDVEEVVIKLSVGPFQIDYYENDLHQEFGRSIDFFKHLKQIGAGYSLTGKSLSSKQMKILTKHWDEKTNPVSVKWHVVYLAAKKDII